MSFHCNILDLKMESGLHIVVMIIIDYIVIPLNCKIIR